MAEVSDIAWTRSTFNPWIGCTKVGPGCDHCYAEALDKRMRYGRAVHWGPGVPRFRTSTENWRKPTVWNRQAPESEFAGRKGFWPVFCASLADVFDNEIPEVWREELFELILNTPNLSWLLVTKRIGNVARMVPLDWASVRFPENLRLLITVVDEDEAQRDIPKLLALPCKNGISYEPAIGRIDFSPWLFPFEPCWNCPCPDPERSMLGFDRCCKEPAQRPAMLEWIIIGGESNQGGKNARPFDVEWAREIAAQCKAAEVPVFVKQLGARPVFQDGDGRTSEGLRDRAGADPSEWPEDLRVQQFPG